MDHQYVRNDRDSASQLVSIKDRGGLYHPSRALYNILLKAEQVFRHAVLSKRLDATVNLQKLRITTTQAVVEQQIGFQICEHDQPLAVGEIAHEYTLLSRVLTIFFNLRLHHYGKVFTSEVINRKEASTRNQASRLTIFKHI